MRSVTFTFQAKRFVDFLLAEVEVETHLVTDAVENYCRSNTEVGGCSKPRRHQSINAAPIGLYIIEFRVKSRSLADSLRTICLADVYAG